MQLELDRETRARVHLAMVGALPNRHGDIGAAYAETCAYAEYPGEVFELARALDAFLSSEAYGGEANFVTVDAIDLRSALGSDNVNWALRLCGVKARINGQSVIWTDALSHEPTTHIILPPDLLERWYSE